MRDADERPPAARRELAAPAGVEIRPATPSDAASYLQMYGSVVAERRWIRTEVIRGGIRHYRRLFRSSWTTDDARIVAVADGRVVGAVSLERLRPAANRHVATLGMMVQAAWRRKGIGAALVAAALEWARSAGIEKVSLEVYPGNDAARALYRRFGFVEEGRLARHSKKSYGYEDEIVMGLWIGPPVDDGAPR